MSYEAEEDAQEAQYDFDPEFQEKIAAVFLRDTNFAMKTNELIKPEYFHDRAVGELVRLVQDHLKVYNSVPDKTTLYQIITDERASKRLRDDIFGDLKGLIGRVLTGGVSIGNPAYVTSRVSDFARRQAIEHGMMASIPLLEKGEYDKIAEIMAKASRVGAGDDDTHIDYFEQIDARTQRRDDLANGRIVRNGITTGYSELDGELYHYGWGRKELSCLMAPAKGGKSMAMGDFAKNAAISGYNVYYDSLEVSKDIISERVDANIADVLMNRLHLDRTQVEAAVKKLSTKGRFLVDDHPTGTLKPSQLFNKLERLRNDGIIIDLCVVDYADIMAAEYRSDNLQENLRQIYIDLRAISHTQNVAMLTATQTNRDGAKAHTAKATDVGDDWNKARTVDLMIGISATEQEKADGEARLSWLLSRNSEDGFSIAIKQERAKMKFLTKVIGRC